MCFQLISDAFLLFLVIFLHFVKTKRFPFCNNMQSTNILAQLKSDEGSQMKGHQWVLFMFQQKAKPKPTNPSYLKKKIAHQILESQGWMTFFASVV